METAFVITFNIRTPDGYETYGRFNIGDDKLFSHSLFVMLKGTEEIDNENILHLDFIETRKGLPVNIKMLHCTLEEMAENCKIITKELFKSFNLNCDSQ